MVAHLRGVVFHGHDGERGIARARDLNLHQVLVKTGYIPSDTIMALFAHIQSAPNVACKHADDRVEAQRVRRHRRRRHRVDVVGGEAAQLAHRPCW